MRFLLPNILLQIVEEPLPVNLVPMPFDNVKSRLLALQSLQHLLILVYDLLVVSQPFLVVQRPLGVLPLLLLGEEVALRRDGSESVEVSLLCLLKK